MNAARWGWKDALVGLAAAGALWWLAARTAAVLDYDWNWPRILGYVAHIDEDDAFTAGLLLEGLATTLRIVLFSSLAALILGGALGLMRALGGPAAGALAGCYVNLVRNLPPLVFIFIFYYFLSNHLLAAAGLDNIAPENPGALFKFFLGDVDRLNSAIGGALCLALFEAAFVAEIVRGGVQAVPAAQWENARALGFGKWRIVLLIVLPQAARHSLPALAGQFVWLVKDSAILSIIAVQDLTFAGAEVAASTKQTFESWMLVLAMYFMLCWPVVALLQKMEQQRGAAKAR